MINFSIAIPAALLAFSGLFSYKGRRIQPFLMVLGFVFSALGDCASSRTALMWKIGFFACAHIFFSIYNIGVVRRDGARFLRREMWPFIICVGAVVVYAFAVMAPRVHEPVLRAGVIGYALLLGTMCLSSASVSCLRRRWWTVAGGVVFIVSDMTLAGHLFLHGTFPLSSFWVLPTYYVALALLWIGAFRGGLE